MPPQECTANCTRSKPDSLSELRLGGCQPKHRWSTMSGNCHYARIDERRRWRKHFSPDCSLAGASPAAVEASAPLSDVRPSVPLLPRRGGVSFRAGEPTVLFREKVDGVKLCLVVGREDHDGSASRDTAIAPPRQICGCSDSISRRDIKKELSGAAAHCHHLSSKWAWSGAIYRPLLAIRQLGY